jgi:pantetheine-phosphate adenylyltransferase
MNKNIKKAIYAGSFDPPTNGHLWIIEEASKLFDKLVVAIGDNPEKKYTFNLNERLDLLKELTKRFTNVEVANFSNEFLVNYASRINANYIIRGIRNSNDYEYEKTMRYINSDLNQQISTIFLMPPRNHVEVSSSMVKGLVGSEGWEEVVIKYTPNVVVKYLKYYYEIRIGTK